jgi:L-iditol 2-dehydrogenase
MKALMYRGPWKMPVEELEEPAPTAGKVVVDVQAVGICGSDVHGFTGNSGRRTPGIVMGHEFAGTISELGRDVEGYAVGDGVVVMPLFSVAAGGDPYPINLSPHRRLTGMNEHGAYAQRVAVREAQLFRKPAGLSWQRAALCEPMAVTLHAARITPINPMQKVAVIGAGPIGLLTMLAARLKGAGTVIVVDRSEHRLELAEELGADAVINVGPEEAPGDTAAAIREMTGGGVDVAFEAVGITATVQQSVDATRNGGNITWIGNNARTVEVDMQSIVTREMSVRGSYGFDETDFAAAIEVLASGRLNVDPLVERVAPLEDGPELFRSLAAGECDLVKIILKP